MVTPAPPRPPSAITTPVPRRAPEATHAGAAPPGG